MLNWVLLLIFQVMIFQMVSISCNYEMKKVWLAVNLLLPGKVNAHSSMPKLKILIVRFSSIGDIVLTTPVIRIAKKQLNAEVHYLTKKKFYDVIKSNPYIDKIHLFDSDLNKTASELRAHSFDLVVDLHNNIRTFRLKKKAKNSS
jgi:hypothetical protein